MNSIERLAAELPAAYELVRWIGMQRRRSRINRALNRAGLVGAGLALGAGAAMLLAPRSGAETRKRLGSRAEKARDYIQSVAPTSDERISTSDASDRPAHGLHA